MTDETLPKPPVASEVVPGIQHEVSAIGSADAPFIYTDWIGAKGIQNNVVAVTLQANRLMEVGGKLVLDRVVVGHLRMPLETMRVLKAVLDEVELLVKPPASEEKN